MTAVAGGGPVLELSHVSVHYGRHVALRDVTVTCPPGAVGLLGPNGAGKSSMIRALLGIVPPAAGTMRVLGLDVRTEMLRIRRRVGYMPESDGHIPGMNAVSFVAYCGELAGMPPADAMQRAHEVIAYVGLGDARYRALETYSTGMKQRIKLAQALVHDPDLLFLDEPTNGLDPKGRDEMLALVRDIVHRRGIHLMLSSHLLPDVEHVCDHVVVLDRGAVAAQGTIAALKGPPGRVFEVRVKGDRERLRDALAGAGLDSQLAADETMRVFVPEGVETRAIFTVAAAEGLQVRHLRASVPTLEDVFARAVGER